MKEYKIDWAIITMIIIGIIMLVFLATLGILYSNSWAEILKILFYIGLIPVVIGVGCWIASNIEGEKLGQIKEIVNRYQGNSRNYNDVVNLIKEINEYNNSLSWKLQGLKIYLSGINIIEELNYEKKYAVECFKYDGLGYNTEINIKEQYDNE